MALAKKHNKGLTSEKRAGATVSNILPDDEANEAFKKIDGNIAGVDWEAETPEQEIQGPEIHRPHINKNQYAALAGDEDDDENWDDQEKRHQKYRSG